MSQIMQNPGTPGWSAGAAFAGRVIGGLPGLLMANAMKTEAAPINALRIATAEPNMQIPATALVVRWIGQVAGAAGGAALGAPDGLKQRAAIGAALGGAIPLLGAPLAAVGAYIATRPKNGRRSNPMGTGATVALVALGLAAAGGAAYAGMKIWKKRQLPDNYLSGFIAPGATLGASSIVPDVEKPIVLNNIQMRDVDGVVYDVANAEFWPPEPGYEDGSWSTNTVFPKEGYEFEGMGNVLGRVVTNLHGSGADTIYDQILDAYIAGAEDPAVIAIAVMKTLKPLIDWANTGEGSSEDMVLNGAYLLAEIARQNMPGFEQPI